MSDRTEHSNGKAEDASSALPSASSAGGGTVIPLFTCRNKLPHDAHPGCEGRSAPAYEPERGVLPASPPASQAVLLEQRMAALDAMRPPGVTFEALDEEVARRAASFVAFPAGSHAAAIAAVASVTRDVALGHYG